jgi:prepilin-type processing-associated H-X9-DG protein
MMQSVVGPTNGEWYRIGYMVQVLPFVEQMPLYNQVIEYEKLGNNPWHNNDFPDGRPGAYRTKLPTILCPSDGTASGSWDMGYINYHCNHGDIWMGFDWWEWRGPFGNGERGESSFAGLVDGSSNTIMFGEVCIGKTGSSGAPVKGGIARGVPTGCAEAPLACYARRGANGMLTGDCQDSMGDVGWGLGRRWGDSHSIYTVFFTVMAPNSPTCSNNGEDWAMPTASSFHPGGVNVSLCDGSVRFISETINAGDPTAKIDFMGDRPQDYTGPSLRGVWGALGSAKAGEPIGNF